jgi:hypothetical protein
MARTGIIAITVISKQNYNLAKEKGERERERRKRRKRSSNNPRVNKYIKVQRTTHLGTFTHLTLLTLYSFVLLAPRPLNCLLSGWLTSVHCGWCE